MKQPNQIKHSYKNLSNLFISLIKTDFISDLYYHQKATTKLKHWISSSRQTNERIFDEVNYKKRKGQRKIHNRAS